MISEILRPSSSHRWSRCYGSVYFEMKAPQRAAGPEADRGTAMHAVAAVLLAGDQYDRSNFSEEEQEIVEEYVHYIDDAMIDYDDIRIEHHLSRFGISGTPDAVLIKKGALEIVDLKTGRGLVEAKGNTQLLIYACMAAAEHNMLDPGLTVTLTIVQPRLGRVDKSVIGFDELMISLGKMINAMDEIHIENSSGNYTFKPGEQQCKYCPGSTMCKARVNHLTNEFGVFINPEIDKQTLADIVIKSKEIKEWLNNAETTALEMLQNGEEIKGIGIGSVRTNRDWKDPELALSVLIEHGLQSDQIYKQTMQTPAQMEKFLPKEVISDLVHKPEGRPKIIVLS